MYIYMYIHVHFRSEPLLCPCCTALWLDQGGGGTLAPSSLSRAIPLFRCLLCRAFFSAARRSREPHFRLPRDLFPPDSFSRLIGSFQPIYGASQGDRVISFGFENGHHLYRAVANFCQPDGNTTIPIEQLRPIFRKILTRREFPNTCEYLRTDTIFIQKKKEKNVTDETAIRVNPLKRNL